MAGKDPLTQANNPSLVPELTADYILEQIRASAVDERQKGAQFERFVKFFLENDPQWSSRLTHVWLWDEAPTRTGKDLGIDLVAQDDSGDYYAIQAKFYDPGRTVSYRVASTFFTAAVPGTYKYLILVNTGKMDQELSRYVESFDKDHEQQNLTLINLSTITESNIVWEQFFAGDDGARVKRTTLGLRGYQQQALTSVLNMFRTEERTKLIMACGTGKTLTSLRITEKLLQGGGSVLYLAPSISLVAQTMRSWANQTNERLNVYVVCSDGKASTVEKGKTDEEILETYGSLADIPAPATTNPFTLAHRFRAKPDTLNVVFSTYQSIGVIHEAQEKGLADFDLAICDEAHRTVGVRDGNNSFRQILDAKYVSASHRLFMTATPRVFSDEAKKKAGEAQADVASMDDANLYGRTAYTYTFGQAVNDGYLADYKVVAMCISPSMMGEELQKRFAAKNSEIPVDDAAKLIGVWKALSNRGIAAAIPGLDQQRSLPLERGRAVLHRGIAFAQNIKVSKRLASQFEPVVKAYQHSNPDDGAALSVVAHHVDGTMNAQQRTDSLMWLSDKVPDDECRILTNAQCLSEGIDVPSLDAVIYFSAKKSKVDIIQSVGRVMRKPRTGNKRYGYLIIPVVIPDGADEDKILASTDYKTVWQVISALRSHDERLDAKINAASLGEEDPLKGTVEIDILDSNKLSAQLRDKPEKETKEQRKAREADRQNAIGGSDFEARDNSTNPNVQYGSDRLNKAIRARIVKRCGNHIYWDLWTEDIAQITARQTTAIKKLIRQGAAKQAFDAYLDSMRTNLNPSYTADEAISVLAQHEVTKPIFTSLFTNRTVVDNNPIVKGLDRVLDRLRQVPDSGLLDLDTDSATVQNSDQAELKDLYRSVQIEALQITSDQARQNLVKEIYNQFFAKAFSKTAQSLGIVYTPVELVDAQLHMVDRALRREFGTRLGAQDVQILDGFAGTGTYISRLIEDSSLTPESTLERKYSHELHADEIVPLAATIMDVNIEQSYHKRMGGDSYIPFPGALLTDTFQTYERSYDKAPLPHLGSDPVFPENSQRTHELLKTPIRVFIGNPPYSVGDIKRTGSQNTKYTNLDKRIEKTYVLHSDATLNNSLYDHYIRAFRWASDQVEKQGTGIVCFVTNGGWLEGAAGAGLRRCFVNEFNSIYVFNLRGNQRTSGEQSRKEGGKIFASGSRATIAITMLVLNPASHEHGVIHYHDIGDYLSRQQKLDILKDCADHDPQWQTLTPDKHGDWLNKRNSDFARLAPLAVQQGTKKTANGIFSTWSSGVKTDRDPWCYSSSKKQLSASIQRLISTYSIELAKLQQSSYASSSTEDSNQQIELTPNGSSIKWSSRLRQELDANKQITFEHSHIRASLYRPFFKQWLYMDNTLNDRPGLQPRMFPTPDSENLEICVPGPNNAGFSCLMAKKTPDLEFAQHGQCFPLYWYEKTDDGQLTLESSTEEGYTSYKRHDAITDRALRLFREVYGTDSISKKDIFFYIYGILHSPEYRRQFENNLRKELPRIPLTKDLQTFRDFTNAGKKLSDLHTDYENADRWPVQEEDGNGHPVPRVDDPGKTIKLSYPEKTINPDTGKKVPDKTVLQISTNMRIAGIPLHAYDYVVNRKSALDWLIDRYRLRTDKQSGITNDPNEWSDDPRYIADLVEKVITVSMKTLDIIDQLPPIDEAEHPDDWPHEWNS